MTDTLNVIIKRRSVRKFKDTPIPENVLNEMLEAARHAPSPGNGQGHCFGIIRDKSLKGQLAEAAGKQMWIAEAPVIFACCADISWDIAKEPQDSLGVHINHLRFGKDFIDYLCEYPNRKQCMQFFENAMPLIPAEHIFLAATAHGLNGCLVGWLDVAKANEILNLPEQLSCLFLLPIGYADESPGQKKLKSIEDITFYDKW